MIDLAGHDKLHSRGEALLDIGTQGTIGVNLSANVGSGEGTIVSQRCRRLVLVCIV